MDTFNIAASITSIILALVAVAQATYYFVKAKESEERGAVALAEIKSATAALEKLSGRYLDRLTKHVTEHSVQQSNDIYQLAMLVAEIPRTRTEDLPKPTGASLTPEQVQEFISLYVLLHHYCALTNICAQVGLPPLSEIDGSNTVHAQLCSFIDMSKADFVFFDNLLASVDDIVLRQNGHFSVYQHTSGQRKAAVKNMGELFVMAQSVGNT